MDGAAHPLGVNQEVVEDLGWSPVPPSHKDLEIVAGAAPEALKASNSRVSHPVSVGRSGRGVLESLPTDAEYNITLREVCPLRDLSLHGELFHVFISYRVASEGRAPGNLRGFAQRLFDDLHILLRDPTADLSIPQQGWGRYPRNARDPRGIKDEAKVSGGEVCLLSDSPYPLRGR
jgi:hypothetical protein